MIYPILTINRHNKFYSRTISVLNLEYYRSKSLSGIGQHSTVGTNVCMVPVSQQYTVRMYVVLF